MPTEISTVDKSFFRTIARSNGTLSMTAIGATLDHGDESDITDFVVAYMADETEVDPVNAPGVTIQMLLAGGEMEWTSEGIITLLLQDESDDPLKQSLLRQFFQLAMISGRFRPLASVQEMVFAWNTDLNHIVRATVDATSGSWDLTVDDGATQETAVLGATDDAATVQAAIEALGHVGAGNVAVTGGPGDAGGTTPYDIDFSVSAAAINFTPVITLADNGGDPLTGGAATVTPLVTQQGHLHSDIPQPPPIIPDAWWEALDGNDPWDEEPFLPAALQPWHGGGPKFWAPEDFMEWVVTYG